MGTRTKYAAAFAIISIIAEIALLTAGMEIPEDTPLLALFVLALAPPLAARAAGLWRRTTVVRLWLATAALTVAGSVAFGTVTGLLAPLLIRPMAGYVAAWMVTRTDAARLRQPEFERR